MDWYFFALISLFSAGFQRFLLKVSVEKQYSVKLVSVWLTLTVAVLSMVFFIISSETFVISQILIVLSLVYGLSFVGLTFFRLVALRYLPTVIFYPLLQIAVVFVVLFSVLYLHESLTLYQGLGMLLVPISVILLKKQYPGDWVHFPHINKGFVLLLLTIFCAIFFWGVPKLATLHISQHYLFMMLAFWCATFMSLMVPHRLLRTESNSPVVCQLKYKQIIMGVGIGILFFISISTYLTALILGPLSIVSVIYSFSSVIVVLLSVVVYKEIVTLRRVMGIVVTLFALFLFY